MGPRYKQVWLRRRGQGRPWRVSDHNISNTGLGYVTRYATERVSAIGRKQVSSLPLSLACQRIEQQKGCGLALVFPSAHHTQVALWGVFEIC